MLKKIPGTKKIEVLGNINIFTTDTYGTYGVLKRLYSRYYYSGNLHENSNEKTAVTKIIPQSQNIPSQFFKYQFQNICDWEPCF